MSNMNPKSPYERPSSETGYESANKASALRDRSTGPSMLIILLAVAAILVIGFLVFGRWNTDGNIAGNSTTSPSTTTETTPLLPPSGSSGSTGSTPDTGGSTTAPATPSTPITPPTPGSGSTTTP
jgi:hypothetical protein